MPHRPGCAGRTTRRAGASATGHAPPRFTGHAAGSTIEDRQRRPRCDPEPRFTVADIPYRTRSTPYIRRLRDDAAAHPSRPGAIRDTPGRLGPPGTCQKIPLRAVRGTLPIRSNIP
jgi:hypothetical protein